MIPLLASDAMREADAQAVARRGQNALVLDAGTAVALEAKRLLDTCYGRRVAVLAGPGLNGADGRVAARWLASRGARVQVLSLDHLPLVLRGYDLVIDAALGLGCSRAFVAPRVEAGTLVLAVDLPSGVDADTGDLLGEPLHADVTIALGAVKPAHLSGAASDYVGELCFAGLDIVTSFRDGVLEDNDLASLIVSSKTDHKWKHALQALVGSSDMPGAAELVLRGALAGGASMIRLESRGDVATTAHVPPEVVRVSERGLDERCRALVAGPGLGPDAATWLRPRLDGVAIPVVLDADGLDRDLIDELSPRDGSWVLTPHEGEFARLSGRDCGPRRLEAVRELARDTGCVVLLKGPTTMIANPEGTVRVVNVGTEALATAGSGDVLAGLITATIARGHDPLDAAALAAHVHARAGARLRTYASASDLVNEIRNVIRVLDHNSAGARSTRD